MGTLSGNFLSDAFDKSDGLSRKPKLDTATVSKGTMIRVHIRPSIMAGKEAMHERSYGKDWRAVANRKGEERGRS